MQPSIPLSFFNIHQCVHVKWSELQGLKIVMQKPLLSIGNPVSWKPSGKTGDALFKYFREGLSKDNPFSMVISGGFFIWDLLSLKEKYVLLERSISPSKALVRDILSVDIWLRKRDFGGKWLYKTKIFLAKMISQISIICKIKKNQWGFSSCWSRCITDLSPSL